jgi:hypothetical protein
LKRRGKMKTVRMTNLVAVLVLGLLAADASLTFASTVFTPVTLPMLTHDMRTWSDGGAYAPLYPSSNRTLAGVPFAFQSNTAGSNVLIPEGDHQYVHIPVDVFGVSTVYTLINVCGGLDGYNIGSLTFSGSGGSSYTIDLVVGRNIRDHYYGGFTNTTTDPMTTQAVFGINSPGHSHYDMQTIRLPSSFEGETLNEILFYGNPWPGGVPGSGAALLAGATVEAVPEPATLLFLGMGGIILSRKKNRN